MTETTEGPLGSALPREGQQYELQKPQQLHAGRRFASMYELFAIPKSSRVKRDATG
jgi:hypothetical protein